MTKLFVDRSAPFQVLCQTLSCSSSYENKDELEKNIQQLDLEELFESAKADEIAPHLVHLLENCKIDFDHKWKIEYIQTKDRIDNLMAELERVASFLLEKKIKIVGLKNAGIAKGIYKNNACSPMGDIDLLISTEDFRVAHHHIISDLGYTFKFRSEFEEEDLEEAFMGGGTEYYKDVNGYKVWLELQWRPVAGRWIQPHNEPNGNELMARSVPIEGSAVRLLAPEDNLLQVCLHTAKHSYCRAPGFRLHTDVDRIVHFTDIDWDHFLKLVKAMKLKTAVYYSLLIPKELLHTPVPQQVINQLKPNWIRRKIIEDLLAKAGLTNQHKKKFSKLGYIIFNLSLYDSIREMSTAVFPPNQVMKKRYQITNNLLIPFYHLKRLKELLFKRAKL